MTIIPTPHELGFDFALAVVASSDTPLLMLSGEFKILAASKSFCRAFQISYGNVKGRAVAELGSGEWDVPQVDALLQATASGYANVDGYEMELQRFDRPARTVLISAHRVEHPGTADLRILFSVADVTEARKSDRKIDGLIHEKQALLKELQGRVANSLQVVTSVMIQSARQLPTNDLNSFDDAHSREASLAALQLQLSGSGSDNVSLKPYLTVLSANIGASMIRDHATISIQTKVEDSVVKADVSICLGLVVTELVINALKHGLPDGRGGTVIVKYSSQGAAWTLAVSDDGIGMGTSESAKAGLGTGIVTALAGQLNAHMMVSDANPGTTVSLIYDPENIDDPNPEHQTALVSREAGETAPDGNLHGRGQL